MNESWICKNCSETIDNNFDVCWNCGTDKDGNRDKDFEISDAGGGEDGIELGELRDGPDETESVDSFVDPASGVKVVVRRGSEHTLALRIIVFLVATASISSIVVYGVLDWHEKNTFRNKLVGQWAFDRTVFPARTKVPVGVDVKSLKFEIVFDVSGHYSLSCSANGKSDSLADFWRIKKVSGSKCIVAMSKSRVSKTEATIEFVNNDVIDFGQTQEQLLFPEERFNVVLVRTKSKQTAQSTGVR